MLIIFKKCKAPKIAKTKKKNKTKQNRNSFSKDLGYFTNRIRRYNWEVTQEGENFCNQFDLEIVDYRQAVV